MTDSFDLSGKVALVTGSSRGIGAAIARQLAAHGAQCIVNYVPDDSGANLADARRVAGEISALDVVECDVANHEQVGKVIGAIVTDHGGLDILVNNAGILRDRSLKKMNEVEWESVLRVNLTGAFNCIHHAASVLRDGGRIVNISSVNAFVGLYGTANYAASKAGLLALTKTAARELAKQRITVNAVAPGFVDTEMTRGMPTQVAQDFLKQIPLGRFATADEIAHAVLFLCSNGAAYITGQTIHVNGGFFVG